MKMTFVMALILVLGALSAQAVVVADFDSGTKPNNIGGDFGAWDKDPADMSQTATETFDKEVTRQGAGYSMRVDYDVDSSNPAFNGFWLKLNNLDASSFKTLSFWAKGDAQKGCTSRFKVELKTEGEKGAYYIDGLTSEWTRFEIPMETFNLSDPSALAEFVIVFEDHTALPKVGTFFIDDISFE